jgi:hypothetical protein
MRDKNYNSTLAGKGAYLSETKIVLGQVAAGCSVDQARELVVEDNFLDYRTRHSRSTAWKEIFRRYFSHREADHIVTLAHWVVGCPISTAVDLSLFYEYCMVDDLLYDLTACCTYDLYQKARTTIDKTDVNEWLSRRGVEHPEVVDWSPATRQRLIGSYLSTIRDFGLVKGVQQKEFYKLYIPREAFVYALYHQKDRGIEGKAVIQSPDWRLFLLDEEDVIFHLEDAANGGFVHFRRAGDIYDLRFIYDDLKEVVDVITE